MSMAPQEANTFLVSTFNPIPHPANVNPVCQNGTPNNNPGFG